MAERSLWATGWYGPWWIQHQLQDQGPGNTRAWIQRGRAQGLKNVFYYDAGEFGQFVVLARDRRIVLNQWELCFYRGEAGQLMWFGKDGFYRDDNPLDLKNYRVFGLPQWTLPNGKPVRSVFELARTSIDGKRDAWDYSHVTPSDEIAEKLKLDSFLRGSQDPVPAAVGRSLGRICSYDHSNPFLLRDFEAGVGMMLTLKPAFLHFDNYFDNETLYPSRQAFGPWSLEAFGRFVRTHVDRATCEQLGIGDPATFDLQQYIANKPFESRGQRLRDFRLLVLPSVACLSDDAIKVLATYASNGGQLILSGDIGTRYGLEHFLWQRPKTSLLRERLNPPATGVAPTNVSVLEPLGKRFYVDTKSGRRAAGKVDIEKAVAACLSKDSRILVTDASATGGVFAYRESSSDMAVDLVNYDLEILTDALTPAPATTVTIRPPHGTVFSEARAMLWDPDLRTAAPQSGTAKSLTPWRYGSRSIKGTRNADGSVTLTVPSFAVYCRVTVPLSEVAMSGGSAQASADTEDKKAEDSAVAGVRPPPEKEVIRLGLSPFYGKYTDVDGFPIIASKQVSDFALREAAYLVRHLLAHRPDVLKALVQAKVRLVVMGFNQWTTDVPEHAHLQPKDYWDRRARGLGASLKSPTVSCAEENLLCYPGDPYSTENIMIHEFGHTIHLVGLRLADPTFDKRLQRAFKSARDAGLWDGTYAGTNRQEYWAEGVQSWFDTNRQNDSQHNHVNTRAELKEYDPDLAKLLKEVFGDEPWRYTSPSTRWNRGHLAGYDPAKAPHFQWPERLKNVPVDHPSAGAKK